MSSLLRQAADMESYSRAAAKWAAEYEAEGDHVRAARYRDDARWYGERAAMYHAMHAMNFEYREWQKVLETT